MTVVLSHQSQGVRTIQAVTPEKRDRVGARTSGRFTCAEIPRNDSHNDQDSILLAMLHQMGLQMEPRIAPERRRRR